MVILSNYKWNLTALFLGYKGSLFIFGCIGIPVPMQAPPRIILVTDGHCTGTNIIAGPDKLRDAEEQAQVKHAEIRMESEGITCLDIA